jgi:hypothetical protein
LSNNINIISQQLQRGGGSVKIAEVTLPTGDYAHCLTVTATSTSNGITVTMSGGDIYATADNTAPDAPTIDVHVLNTGMGHSCGDSSYYYQWITLTVTN